MTVRICFRKVYNKLRKEPRRVIIERVDGVIDKSKLPADYLEKGPKFYRFGDWLIVYDEKGVKVFDRKVNFDGKYPEREVEIPWSEFKEVLEIMREAGERLHKINKKHKTEKELWEEDGLIVEI